MEFLDPYICPELIILPELRDHLPGVPETTDAELERQLLSTNGAVDSVVVWKGRNIITDGHRRYRFCRKHNLRFPVREMDYADIQAVKDWMDSWENSRRNMSPPEKAQLLARRFDCLRRENPGLSSKATADLVGKEQNVDRATVYRARQQDKALKSLPDDLRARITSQEVRLSLEDLLSVADLGELHQRGVFKQYDDELAAGSQVTFHEILQGEGKASDDDDIEEFAVEEPEDDEPDPEPDNPDSDETSYDEDDFDEVAPCDQMQGDDIPFPVDPEKPVEPPKGGPLPEPGEIREREDRRPSNKPVRDQLKIAEKLIGKVNQILLELQDNNPKLFIECRSPLLAVGAGIRKWQGAAS